MRIGFDARMLDHPGIGRYIRSILPEVIKLSKGDEFFIFGNKDLLGSLSLSGKADIIRYTKPIYSLQEQFAPFDKYDLDILHAPHFNIPLFSKTRLVVTVHDLIYLLFPESTASPLAKMYASYMLGKTFSKSSKIIAVSENTKKDIIKIQGESVAPKIEVVYEGVTDEFIKNYDKTKITDVRSRYSLSEKILLYVGSVKPHKNIKALLEVFKKLKSWGVPHQLVIAGRWDRKENYLKKELEGPDVRYVGEVPQEDLIALYSMTEALVHLSKYEGFGLTLLEAMKCGTPVVSSNRSSLPEVAGSAAFLVDPDDINNTADVVYNVLANKDLQEGMIEKGFQQVKKFSWGEAAKKTLEVYHNAL